MIHYSSQELDETETEVFLKTYVKYENSWFYVSTIQKKNVPSNTETAVWALDNENDRISGKPMGTFFGISKTNMHFVCVEHLLEDGSLRDILSSSGDECEEKS